MGGRSFGSFLHGCKKTGRQHSSCFKQVPRSRIDSEIHQTGDLSCRTHMTNPSEEEPTATGPAALGEGETQTETIEAELAAGARAFAFKNYAVATECFSKACELLTAAQHAGPQDLPKIIHAHLLYGKALLQNAISLASLSGPINPSHSLPPNHPSLPPPDDAPPPSSSKAAGDASTSKAASQAATKGIQGNAHIHFSGDSSDDEDAGEGEDADDSEGGAGQGEEAADQVTVEDELENAFHVLEFARQTIVSQIDASKDLPQSLPKLQDKLIEVNDLIAQVHQEGEQFELAVESYKSSLEVKKSRGEVSAGGLAETHLMIALALELIPDESGARVKEAIGHVEEAIEVMKGELERLRGKKGLVAGSERKKEADGGATSSSEIEETESLIRELEAKRDELQTVPQAPPMSEKDKALEAYLAAISNSHPLANGKAAVNDLSNLVKKRPRPVDSPLAPPNPHTSELPATVQAPNPSAETPAKKLKPSDDNP